MKWMTGITQLWKGLPAEAIPAACVELGGAASLNGFGDWMASFGGENWWQPQLNSQKTCIDFVGCQNQCILEVGYTQEVVTSDQRYALMQWIVETHPDISTRPTACGEFLKQAIVGQSGAGIDAPLNLENACTLGGVPSSICPAYQPSPAEIGCADFLQFPNWTVEELTLRAIDEYALTRGDLPRECTDVIGRQVMLEASTLPSLRSDIEHSAECVSDATCPQLDLTASVGRPELTACAESLRWSNSLDSEAAKEVFLREVILASPWKTEPYSESCIAVIRSILDQNQLEGFYWQVFATAIE